MTMRLVDVTSFFSDTCGGIKTYYRNKARLLPSLGVECHFVVPGKRATDEAFEAGVLHRVPGPRFPGNGNYRFFADLGRLGRLLRDLRPDVIEIGSHYLLPALVERWTQAQGRARPALVGFLHSDVVGTLIAPSVSGLPFRAPIVRQGWRWVRHCHRHYRSTFVASETMRSTLESQGVSPVRWVGLGVDTTTFRPATRTSRRPRPRVIYCGRLSSDKEFELILRAFPSVHAATGAELCIVGDGPQRGLAHRFARERPEQARIIGYLASPSAVAQALADADVVVVPGRYETFSLATAEAMACGVPVLVPDGGAASELVLSSEAGSRFAAGDAARLARRLIDLLGLPESERSAMGARGRRMIESQYDWTRVMARLHRAYQDVAS